MQVRALQRSEDEASSFCSAINQTEAHRCRRTAHLRDWGPDPPRPPVDTLCPGLRRVSAPCDRQVALVVHVATAAPTLGRLGRAVSRRSRGCLQPLTAPCYPHPHLPPAGTGSRWWSCCWLHRPARPWLVRATRSSRRATQPPTTKNQKPKTNTQQHPTQHPTQHPHVISTSRSTSSHTLYPLSRSRSHLLMRPSRCATRSHSSPPPSPTPRPTGSARCSARPRAARHRSACGWCAPHRCAVTHRGGPA